MNLKASSINSEANAADNSYLFTGKTLFHIDKSMPCFYYFKG